MNIYVLLCDVILAINLAANKMNTISLLCRPGAWVWITNTVSPGLDSLLKLEDLIKSVWSLAQFSSLHL